MTTNAPTDKTKYVLLRSVSNNSFGLKPPGFFTTYNKDQKDPTKLANGETAYEVIGYTETVKEAQLEIFGTTTATHDD